MKNGFLLIAALLLMACSDFAKKDQLVKITDLQKKISVLEGQVTKNKIDSISEISLSGLDKKEFRTFLLEILDHNMLYVKMHLF